MDFLSKNLLKSPEEMLPNLIYQAERTFGTAECSFSEPGPFLEAAETLSPEIFSNVKLAYENSHQNTNTKVLNREDYEACPSDSIDFAIMEKIQRCLCSTFKDRME